MTRGILSALLAATLLVGGASVAAAQAGADAPRRQRAAGETGQRGNAERMAAALFKDIELSATQLAQVKAVHGSFEPRMRQLREEMRAARESRQPNPARRERVQALTREQHDSLRVVLTADQRPIFDRNVAALRDRRPGERRERARQGRGQPRTRIDSGVPALR